MKNGIAEAVAAAEVERGVGERPRLAGDVRAVVRTRAILARELEAQLVQHRAGQRRGQRAGDGVGEARSTALALRPHESTSKVPFCCSLQV